MHTNFCIQQMIHCFQKLIFSDEATFHLSGKVVNRYAVHIWSTNNTHAVMEHVRDSLKVNVFCAICTSHVYGPLFFTERTVTSVVYLDMLQLWLMP